MNNRNPRSPAAPEIDVTNLVCPTPQSQYDRVLLGHGGGGRLSADLIQRLFLPLVGNDILSALEDQATLDVDLLRRDGYRLALTTDSFVVRPIFFPGGNIGSLAVNGTLNDLAVGGAKPLYLAAAFILEEGLPIGDLQRVVQSMRVSCDSAGVRLVAADTKVVDRGKADQLFLTTTGLGLVPPGSRLSIQAAQPGDRVLVSGTIGDHGIAIMSLREGIEFETILESDCASLVGLTQVMLEQCPSIRAMRDPTRGGLSSALHELAAGSRVGVKLVESAIPVRDEVRAACEMLGLDPLHVACEGKLMAVVSAEHADQLLAAMRTHPLGQNAAIIGQIVAEHPGMVTIRSGLGGERVVTQLSGEQLPRIC